MNAINKAELRNVQGGDLGLTILIGFALGFGVASACVRYDCSHKVKVEYPEHKRDEWETWVGE